MACPCYFPCSSSSTRAALGWATRVDVSKYRHVTLQMPVGSIFYGKSKPDRSHGGDDGNDYDDDDVVVR